MKRNSSRLIALAMLLLACAPIATPAADASARRAVQSRHYQIYSDLDPALTDDLARRMDQMYDEYARRLADFAPSRGSVPRLEAHLFARRRDYQRFTGDAVPNTAGVFIPDLNALAAVYEDVGRDELRRTLQHEAFHQFAHNYIAHGLPPWLDEGLAELFEDGVWTGDGFRIGQVPVGRIEKLRRDVSDRRLVPLAQVLRWDREAWNARMVDSRAAGVQYNQAWAMAHFLVFATEGNTHPHYRPHLIDMLARLKAGQNGWDAFRYAFSENVAGFQTRFVAYTDRLRPTPDAVYIHHHSILAQMLRLQKDAGVEYTAFEQFRDHVIRHRLRLFREEDGDRVQTADDPSVYFKYTGPGGAVLPPTRQYFASRDGAPLPDLVTIPTADLQLRTRFHTTDAGKLEAELLIEHPTRLARGDR